MTYKRFCDRCGKQITDITNTTKYTIKYDAGLFTNACATEQDLCPDCTSDFIKFILEAKGWEKK